MPSLELASDMGVAGASEDTLNFQAALTRQIGVERVALWWSDGIEVAYADGCATISVDRPFLLERLRSRLSGELSQTAKELFGPETTIQLQLSEQIAPPGEESRKKDRQSQATLPKTSVRIVSSVPPAFQPKLNPPRTMSNFLVGPSNQLAAAAAQLVARQPGAASPLYIHGPTGCGKTHLLDAIKQLMRAESGLRRVVMMTAEEFTNDFMGALQGSGLPSFRRRYRDLDAFGVDDIQFLDGKKATLREFQFTVDSLIRARKQLIVTADRPPMELDGIDPELAGRLAGGMVCSVAQLEVATRASMVTNMAQAAGLRMAEGVAEQAAHRLSGDGRLLCGFICRLRAVSQFVGGEITWEIVREHAEDLLGAGVQTVGLKEIQKAVCDTFNLPTGALQGRGQQQVYSQPRMLAMYLARRYSRAALSEIGQFFGDRSHSTVIAASKRVERWLNQGNTVRRGDRAVDLATTLQSIERQLKIG